MGLELQKQGSSAIVWVRDEITIYTIAQQTEQLLLWAKELHQLTLDLSGASEIDSAGIQLLLLLNREMTQKQGLLRLQNPSTEIRNLFSLLHLSSSFALEPENSPVNPDQAKEYADGSTHPDLCTGS